MGSPDYVGTAHQVLDGTMLDLDVSADFLRGVTMAGTIVDYDVTVGGGYAEGVIILRCAFAVGDVILGGEVAEGGMTVRCGVTVDYVVAVLYGSIQPIDQESLVIVRERRPGRVGEVLWEVVRGHNTGRTDKLHAVDSDTTDQAQGADIRDAEQDGEQGIDPPPRQADPTAGFV